MGQDYYKVLWIEDDGNIVESAQQNADGFGLDLIRFSNWDEAKEELNANFEDYSALILDANCKIKRDGLEEGRFIPVILPDLTAIFAQRQKFVPWYIYSAGTMENFDFVIDAADVCRADFNDEWGKMLFRKDVPEDNPDSANELFRQIRETAQDQCQNTVLYRHKEVFTFLGRNKVIDSREAKSYMLKMLEALYFPEENLKFQYEGNPIRKVLEYMFRSAEKVGLVPKGFADDSRLSDSGKFMSGSNVPLKKNGSEFIRWGEEGIDGVDGNRIFDRDVELCVKSILNYSNPGSHARKEKPFLIDEETKELFFGYVMQLCYVIHWFGKYVKGHSNVEENRKMHRIVGNVVPKPQSVKPVQEKRPEIFLDDMIGKEGCVLNEGAFLYVLSCKLSLECAALVRVSDRIRIDDVEENNEEKTKKKYPFIATKITLLP